MANVLGDTSDTLLGVLERNPLIVTFGPTPPTTGQLWPRGTNW